MKSTNKYIHISVIFLCLISVLTTAGVLIDAGDYTATVSSEYATREVVYAVNGAGLSDPSGNLPTTHSGFYNPAGLAWHTLQNDVSGAWLIVDLGAVYTLDSMHVWNYNHVGSYAGATSTELTRGIQEYNLWVRTDDSAGNNTHDSGAAFDATGWTSLLQDQTLSSAPGLNTYSGETVVFLNNSIQSRFVAIEVLSNYNNTDLDNDGDIDTDPFGDFVGLSEIRFFAVPEPATLLLIACGSLIIARRK